MRGGHNPERDDLIYRNIWFGTKPHCLGSEDFKGMEGGPSHLRTKCNPLNWLNRTESEKGKGRRNAVAAGRRAILQRHKHVQWRTSPTKHARWWGTSSLCAGARKEEIYLRLRTQHQRNPWVIWDFCLQEKSLVTSSPLVMGCRLLKTCTQKTCLANLTQGGLQQVPPHLLPASSTFKKFSDYPHLKGHMGNLAGPKQDLYLNPYKLNEKMPVLVRVSSSCLRKCCMMSL